MAGRVSHPDEIHVDDIHKEMKVLGNFSLAYDIKESSEPGESAQKHH